MQQEGTAFDPSLFACPCICAVYTFANISGGHLNPAVSFALMCTGHMKWWKALLYMVAQVSLAGDTSGTGGGPWLSER